MRTEKQKCGENVWFKWEADIESVQKRLHLTLEKTTSCCCGENKWSHRPHWQKQNSLRSKALQFIMTKMVYFVVQQFKATQTNLQRRPCNWNSERFCAMQPNTDARIILLRPRHEGLVSCTYARPPSEFVPYIRYNLTRKLTALYYIYFCINVIASYNAPPLQKSAGAH